MKARLIIPTNSEAVVNGSITWDGCEYSKCGRTDRGVSAFGQVVGLRVRSKRPVTNKLEERVDGLKDLGKQNDGAKSTAEATSSSEESRTTRTSLLDAHPIRDEIPYAQVLNRLLPADVRILAWCPAPPPNFSARFSCRERQYRYFFTQPAFNPTFGPSGFESSLTTQASTDQKRREGWLDIEAMKKAAKLYEGLHDFRNFCKMDPAKQISNYSRRIFRSEIEEVDFLSEPAAYIAGSAFAEFKNNALPLENGANFRSPPSASPKIYQFILHGSAFLWHQVRHMMAILFLIGQGLETPELITRLLDAKNNPEKPHYEMAEDVPLVLWDCIFPAEASDSSEDSLHWLWVGDEHGTGDEELNVTSGFRGAGKYGNGGLVDSLWEHWRKKKMDEVLAGSLLNLANKQGRNNSDRLTEQRRPSTQKTYFGGDSYENRGVYVPVLDRKRVEAPEVLNKRWAEKNGSLRRTSNGKGIGPSQPEIIRDHLEEV